MADPDKRVESFIRIGALVAANRAHAMSGHAPKETGFAERSAPLRYTNSVVLEA